MAKKPNNVRAFFVDGCLGTLITAAIYAAVGIGLFFFVPWLFLHGIEFIGSLLGL